MAGRALLLRAEPGFSLPAFERFAPPPPPALVTARIEAALQPRRHRRSTCSAAAAGSRGPPSTGSAGRSASSRTPLDRMLAEVVLRPPDLRHLDAAFQALAASAAARVQPQGLDRRPLRDPLRDLRAGRSSLDEITWAAEADGEDGRRPARARRASTTAARSVATSCGGGEQRQAPLDAEDLAGRSTDVGAAAVRGVRSRARFPVARGRRRPRRRAARPPHAAPAVGARRDPRADRGRPPRRTDRGRAPARAAPCARCPPAGWRRRRAGSRRCGSRRARQAPGRRRSGASATRGSRSRTASGWCAGSSSGSRAAPTGPVPARLGDDLRSLVEGTATASSSWATSGGARRARAGDGATRGRRRRTAARPARPRPPPLRPAARPARLRRTTATAWVLGREAAALLPARAAVRARGPRRRGAGRPRRSAGRSRRRAGHGP